MLLDVVSTSGSIPATEQIKWHWFENQPELRGGDARKVPHLWFLYQACDLMRLAYEVILSAALTLLESAPGRRMTLSGLVDDLVGFADVAGDRAWEDVPRYLADGSKAPARVHAAAMLEAMRRGDTASQVNFAVSLIALLHARASDAGNLIEAVLREADHFQSLRTEKRFLEGRRTEPARRVVAEMIRDRIVKRHLWVASRKFRSNLRPYTFHIEPEEGRLRYRSHFTVSPSSPRLDQALRFLRDVGFLDGGGITQLGRAAMATP
jgi:hypothetical protein